MFSNIDNEDYKSPFAEYLFGEADEAALSEQITFRIDGEPVTVMNAVPATDDQGNIRRDEYGKIIPRWTTIYDALKQLDHEQNKKQATNWTPNRIPILCHQDHMTPAAVCRVCSVMVVKRGSPGVRLFPACQHRVYSKMEVFTEQWKHDVRFRGAEGSTAGDYIRRNVRTLLELLASRHVHRDQLPNGRRFHNELLELCERYDVPVQRGEEVSNKDAITSHRVYAQPQTPFAHRDYDASRCDQSSQVVAFDRNLCIHCDRCVRACREVKPFQIIGHTGFGNQSHISFDLNVKMGESNCVSCGECAISCPTGALSFKSTVYQDRDPWKDHTTYKPVTVSAEELAKTPPFDGVPYAFLKWNEGAVGKAELKSGDELCKIGEYGSTAFLLTKGQIKVEMKSGEADRKRHDAKTVPNADYLNILGEMACLNNAPRSATLRADGDCEVLVIRRNMLHMLQRNAKSRRELWKGYCRRALEDFLFSGPLFEGLPRVLQDDCRKKLKEIHDGDEKELEKQLKDKRSQGGKSTSNAEPIPTNVNFVIIEANQEVFRQGEEADALYFIYFGRVEVSEIKYEKYALVRDYIGPGRHFGEIGLLPDDSGLVEMGLLAEYGKRTGTCKALERVGLVRISREAFNKLLDIDRATILSHVKAQCQKLLEKNKHTRARVESKDNLAKFLELGLHQGQNLLTIDLHACTRCQECVRACADSHQAIPRLSLTGDRRFNQFLIPFACRSCHDPKCLVGCPVDAIHRRPLDKLVKGHAEKAIHIESHCIGCGLCAHNCPFDSIIVAKSDKHPHSIARLCDLCASLDGEPRCVNACPHDAAHRERSGYEFAHAQGLNPLGSLLDDAGRKPLSSAR